MTTWCSRTSSPLTQSVIAVARRGPMSTSSVRIPERGTVSGDGPRSSTPVSPTGPPSGSTGRRGRTSEGSGRWSSSRWRRWPRWSLPSTPAASPKKRSGRCGRSITRSPGSERWSTSSPPGTSDVSPPRGGARTGGRASGTSDLRGEKGTMSALWGTSAPLTSDLIVPFEIGVAVLLVVGALLVRRGHIRAHMVVQTTMVLVNIPVVLIWIVPQYLAYVLPDLPGEIGEAAYLVPTVMLVAGAAAEVLGMYVVLVAGTNLVPERYRFRRYKLWMRTELVLWWSVILFGLLTYYSWYILGGLS